MTNHPIFMIILAFSLILHITHAQDEGFTPNDLYRLMSQGYRTYEELDILVDENMPEPEDGYNPIKDYIEKPWFFKIDNEQLQVTQSKIQSRYSDFTFIFKLKRDMNFNKTAYITFDFRDYFIDIESIGEYPEEWGKFDKDLF